MALAERTAEVQWNGTLADGDGSVRAGSLAVTDLPLDWASRSDRADGKTSPEELLAAAHASCYAMSLTLLLARDGKRAEHLDVKAKCSLEERGGLVHRLRHGAGGGRHRPRDGSVGVRAGRPRSRRALPHLDRPPRQRRHPPDGHAGVDVARGARDRLTAHTVVK